MRNYLKKSGLASIIVLSVISIVFLPKQIAQWLVLIGITTVGIFKGIEYLCTHKEEFCEKRKKRRKRTEDSETRSDIRYAVIQLSHRITDKLHSAFPESSWHWLDEPNANLFLNGGRVRIATTKTENFSEADVILDSFGRIDIKMLETSSFTDVVKNQDEKADTDYTVDAKAWYEQWGQKVLTDLITELNARGTKVLCIKEDGSVVIDEDKQVGLLKAFPTKNLWKKLIGVFEESGLTAVENEHGIEIGW